jgi:hypothetical protein
VTRPLALRKEAPPAAAEPVAFESVVYAVEEAVAAAHVLTLYLDQAHEPDGARVAALLHRDLETQAVLLRAFMDGPDDPAAEGRADG